MIIAVGIPNCWGHSHSQRKDINNQHKLRNQELSLDITTLSAMQMCGNILNS